MIDLRPGSYIEALANVVSVDAVISDPPYSEHTHTGQSEVRADLSYIAWGADDVDAFVDMWAPRCSGWLACMCDDDLVPVYKAAYRRWDRFAFAAVPLLAHQPRFSGDGPGCGAVNLVVSRPRERRFIQWGSLPGWYNYTREQSPCGIKGAKPIDLMRALVRDYSKPGDLVCDPCAGGASTLIAARIEGRRAIGAECDPTTYAKALLRCQQGDHAVRVPAQGSLFEEAP